MTDAQIIWNVFVLCLFLAFVVGLCVGVIIARLGGKNE